MRLKQLRVRSLVLLAVSALLLILVGVVMCFELLGTGAPAFS